MRANVRRQGSVDPTQLATTLAELLCLVAFQWKQPPLYCPTRRGRPPRDGGAVMRRRGGCRSLRSCQRWDRPHASVCNPVNSCGSSDVARRPAKASIPAGVLGSPASVGRTSSLVSSHCWLPSRGPELPIHTHVVLELPQTASWTARARIQMTHVCAWNCEGGECEVEKSRVG